MRADGLIKGTRTPGAARTLRSSRKNPSVPSSSCPQRGLAVVYPPGAWHGLVTQQQNGERRGGSCCRVRAAPAAAPSSRDSSKDSIHQPEVKEKPSLPSQRLLQSLPPAEILLPERAQPRMPNTEGGGSTFPQGRGAPLCSVPVPAAPCQPLPRGPGGPCSQGWTGHAGMRGGMRGWMRGWMQGCRSEHAPAPHARASATASPPRAGRAGLEIGPGSGGSADPPAPLSRELLPRLGFPGRRNAGNVAPCPQ